MIALVRGDDGRVQWVALHQKGDAWSLIQDAGQLDFVLTARDCVAHLQTLIERALAATRDAHACYRCGSIVQTVKYLEHTLTFLEEAAGNAARLLDQPGPEDELAEGIELAGPGMTANEIFLYGVIAAAASSYRETGQPVSPWAWKQAASLFLAMIGADDGDEGTTS